VGEKLHLSATTVAWPPTTAAFPASTPTPQHPPHLPTENGPSAEVHRAAWDPLPLPIWQS
jgi:hypothetical protein